MIVSSIPLQTKPRCVWEDTAITPIIRTSYNWITWWLEVRKQYIKTLVKGRLYATVYQVHFITWIFESCFMESFFSLIDAIFLLSLFLRIVDLVDWAEKRDHVHCYPFLRVASVVASTCNASYWLRKAVSACKLDESFVESILFSCI